jgi:Uma2 family endonuclease
MTASTVMTIVGYDFSFVRWNEWRRRHKRTHIQEERKANFVIELLEIVE